MHTFKQITLSTKSTFIIKISTIKHGGETCWIRKKLNFDPDALKLREREGGGGDFGGFGHYFGAWV